MFGLCRCGTVDKFTLKSVSVECNIRNLLVTCTSEFVYKNDTGNNAEAMFSFPLDGSCVVYGFQAVIGNKTIVGLCKELEEAKNLYEAAKEAGHKAAIIERNRSMTDVFNCRIGNMPADSEAKITLKFAMELKLSLSKNEDDKTVDRFSLCLPLILRPRYTPANYDGNTEVYHVTNKYDYNFQATMTGTKEIKNVFSNNHQLKLVLTDDKSTRGQVTLESKYDGTHDLDIYIEYVTMKVPSVLYEYGTMSNKFTGIKVPGAYYQTDVAMLNFLPDFEINKDSQSKKEIILVVDRSGSMSGSNILHAKECLLIFLKSLPTNCKFQIYGFGTTFDKAFPLPQLYDDRSIEIAMNYQRNIAADLGGTEIMGPLRDIYAASMSSDYTRVVFLLTDGDVGNQDEVIKLVRQHNHSTRLFTVGIGDGVSTSLVQQVAESGLGKAAFIRDSKMLSASVIELLDIALNCSQFTDCKVEWQCPDNVSVIMVPSVPGPIFANYFLTLFCVITGLTEHDTVICQLSGKVNGQSITLSLDVNGKVGVSDEEFRVHRLMAKYKIDEMTALINDGQEELKKPLIELSLAVNMVTNYTTFVAIDQDAPNKDVMAIEDIPEFDDYASGMYLCQSSMSTKQKMVRCAMPRMKECAVFPTSNYGCSLDDYDEIAKNKSRSVFGGCFKGKSKPKKHADLRREEKCVRKSSARSSSAKSDDDGIPDNIVLYIADQQNIKGHWSYNENVLTKLGLDFAKVQMNKPDSINDDVWMTIIVYEYLNVKLPNQENEWRLLAKKAKQWLLDAIHDSAIMDKLLEQGRTML